MVKNQIISTVEIFVEIINTMGLTSNLKINLFSKLTRQIFIKHYIRASSNYSVNRIVPATDEFVWDTSNPVKLRMENTAPGNYPPMLVQTMMRNTVAKHGSKTAIGKKHEVLKNCASSIQAIVFFILSLVFFSLS